MESMDYRDQSNSVRFGQTLQSFPNVIQCVEIRLLFPAYRNIFQTSRFEKQFESINMSLRKFVIMDDRPCVGAISVCRARDFARSAEKGRKSRLVPSKAGRRCTASTHTSAINSPRFPFSAAEYAKRADFVMVCVSGYNTDEEGKGSRQRENELRKV